MDDYSPLAASLLAARRSLQGLVVAIDGMCLGPLPAGTQVVVVETVRALAERPEVYQLLVYTPMEVPDYVRTAFDGNSKITVRQTLNLKPQQGEKAHVVYRPYQVRDADELEWLRSIGERVVINQLDLIAYHDAAYFDRDHAWRAYRDLAKLSAYAVDGLTYLSEHSRDRRPGRRACCPTTSRTGRSTAAPSTPRWCRSQRSSRRARSRPRPVSCSASGCPTCTRTGCLPWQMLAELHRQGWRGSLVLAGAQPPDGSSLPAEARFLLDHPELAPYVVNLGMISEAEKVWLYSQAGLVLYPTISEGFGLIPFEAAHYGVPCLSTRQGSLVEVLPDDIPVIEDFDPVSAAAAARALLDDPAAGQKVVDQILAKGTEFSWARVAGEVIEVLNEVTSRPACRVVAIRGEQDFAYLAEAGLGPAAGGRR